MAPLAAAMTKAHITVHLKPGISDPDGQNTIKALHLLGFTAVKSVHTTKVWTVDFGAVPAPKAQDEADKICRRLLTNPVIHDYEIKVE